MVSEPPSWTSDTTHIANKSVVFGAIHVQIGFAHFEWFVGEGEDLYTVRAYYKILLYNPVGCQPGNDGYNNIVCNMFVI